MTEALFFFLGFFMGGAAMGFIIFWYLTK